MEEKKERSEFLVKSEEFAKQVAKLVNSGDGKSLVIIAMDKGEVNTEALISVIGKGELIIDSLCEFAMNGSTSEMFRQASRIAALRRYASIMSNKAECNCEDCKKEKELEKTIEKGE